MSDTPTLQEQFAEAAERIKTRSQRPDNNTMLKLYSLYKQSTLGKCNTSQPWAVQLEARAKWDAWNALGDLSKDDAMKRYVKLVNKLME